MTEQRRLAAILVADVVGYSKLMGGDEAGTLAQLRALRTEIIEPQIAKHAGRLFKSVGDGFLIEFASAVQAVSCAKAIQEANGKGRLPLRIGIHVGDVVVQGDDLMGDGVNVAARVEGIAELGGIAVTRAVHEQVRDKLDLAFVDKGEIALKNIQRPVQVFVSGEVKANGQAVALPLPDKPSIAVLPFQNMSGDPEQEYFSDGVTEDIITELSRFHSLFVTARNSSFTYKGKPVDVRHIGRELGVRYVLEGSIRRVGRRIRISAQLNDTLAGSHIWAERYDRVVEDIFDVQEEATQAIVAAIAPQIESAEIAKTIRRRPDNLGAYELALRAWAEARNAWTKSDLTLLDGVVETAKQALSIDAQCGLAMVAIAFSLWQRHLYASSETVTQALDEGIALTSRAVEIDPTNHLALTIRGMLRYRAGHRENGLGDLRQAHRQNPNDAMTLMCLGFTEALFGNAETGVEYELKVLRLSPRDFWRPTMHANLAISYFVARQYELGKDAALAAVREAPTLLVALNMLALNLVGLGEIEAASKAINTMRAVSPSYYNDRVAGGYAFQKQDDVTRATTFIRIAAGLADSSAAKAFV